jgi:MraZ protein
MEQGGAAEVQQEGTATTVRPRANVFGHASHSGTYRSKLEASGRLVLPAALRAPLVAAGAGHLLARQGRSLHLYTPLAFEVMVDHVIETQGAASIDPEARQVFFKAAPRVSIDKQARLVLPPELRAMVGLEGEADVVVAGAIERIEIWAAATFDAVEVPRSNLTDLLLDGHGGLPTGTA